MKRSRYRLVASVVAMCCLAAACGSDGAADSADAAVAETVATGPLTDLEIEAACRRAFVDFVAGAAVNFDRPYVEARFGLAMAGTDCFVTHHGDDGALLEVGDVSFIRGDGGSPVASVAWSVAGAIPEDVTARLMRSIAVVQPGGGPEQLVALQQAAAADAAAAMARAGSPTETSVGSSTGESMTGGGSTTAAPGMTRPAAGSVGGIGGGTAATGTSGPGGNVGGDAGSGDTRAPAPTTTPAAPTTPSDPGSGSGGWWATTVPPPPPTNPPRSNLDAAQLADLQARCVYLGEASACATLEANGYPASGNHGLGTTLTSAGEAALVEDCSNSFRLACLELERRFPPGPGDGGAVTTFVNGVLAGSVETIESVSSPGLVTHVPALGRGPFDDSPGSGVPATSFGADGRLTFRIGPSSVVRCYVGSGSVRHCSVGAS